MANKSGESANFDERHLYNLQKYQKQIDRIYSYIWDEAAKLGISTGFEPGDKAFSFDYFPKEKKKLTDLMWRMRQDVERTISSGIEDEFDLSDKKNMALVDDLTKNTDLTDEQIEAMQPRNADAVKAFQQRKVNGLGLSDRVWNLTNQAEAEISAAIDLSLASGQSAAQLSRDVRKLLKEPDMMYRRFHEKIVLKDGTKKDVAFWRRKVVDEDGNVHWVKEDLAHTGVGVYRSSYKNAMRMARTETNMAYHKADANSWNSSDIVIGQRIMLSNNHTSNGKELKDICDRFSGLEFPKEFDFTGWHPQCRCVAVPITPSRKEMLDYLKRKANGEDVSNYKFSGEVTQMPDEFLNWVGENSERLADMQSRGKLPYFIKNNFADGFQFDGDVDFRDGLRWTQPEPEPIPDVKPEQEPTPMQPNVKAPTDDEIRQRMLDDDAAQYTEAQRKNFAEIEKKLGQKRGLSMSYEDANKGKENPHFGERPGYNDNCQTCVLVHEMRRRGFNVEAFENVGEIVWKIYEKAGINSGCIGRWKTEDGRFDIGKSMQGWMFSKGIKTASPKKLGEFLMEMTKGGGRFEITCRWKGGGAHVFCGERNGDKIRFFDPQSGESGVINKYAKIAIIKSFTIMRVDDKVLNPAVVDTFIKLGELPIKVQASRREQIMAIAAKRHAERTKEQADAIKDAWKKDRDKAAREQRRAEIMKMAELRHANRDDAAVQKKWDDRKQQHAEWKKAIDDTIARVKANEWMNDDAIISYRIYDKPRPHITYNLKDIAERSVGINKSLDTIDKIKPLVDAIPKLKSGQSQFSSRYFMRDMIKTNAIAGNEKQAMQILSELQKFDAVEKSYVDMRAYKTKSGKITKALDEAEALLKRGNVSEAEKKIQEAEDVMRINEASKASKAAKKQAELEAKQKAAEAKTKKKSLADAQSFDDIKEILGDDLPYLLEHYEDSIKREQYTKKEYQAKRKEIERKLKEFFEEVDFSHCTDPMALDGYLKKGVLTNLQMHSSETYYDMGRRYYGHYAYDLPGYDPKYGGDGYDFVGEIPTKNKLGAGDYYRCGVPVRKDITGAYEHDKSGYGGAQIVFRRDRVVTTFTLGNSLAENTIPSLTCDPKICSLDNKSLRDMDAKKYTIESTRRGNGYIEIQYLPLKSKGAIMPRDMERITLGANPERYYPKSHWEKWAAEGVSIYYMENGKAKLYIKGKPLITQAEAKVKVETMSDFDDWMKDPKAFNRKDCNYTAVAKAVKDGDYISALTEIDKIRAIEARVDAMKTLIPDADKFHKKFTVQELEAAHSAIEAKFKYLESKCGDRYDDWTKKLNFEMDYVENPGTYKAGATRHATWEVSKAAYSKKMDEVIGTYKGKAILAEIDDLRAFSTDKKFTALVGKATDLANEGKWQEVQKAVEVAKKAKVEMLRKEGIIALEHGESSAITFGKSDFSKARKAAAKMFEDPDVKKAYKEADAYMSQYAEEMWAKLSQEEKKVLWMYSNGSRYINEEILGTYCLGPKYSDVLGESRYGRKDVNILTSIIEKSPALKDDVVMQHVRNRGGFEGQFGIDLTGLKTKTALKALVGKEAVNDVFMSCCASKGGDFASGRVSTGAANDVVFDLYLPAGTKGVYMEPFAAYGDNMYGGKGLKWDGKKRKGLPSGQVEYLVQRGAKMRITSAEYRGGKWYIEAEVIGFEGQKAFK